MYRHVLVGTDGSPTAGLAVAAASRLAVALGVPLVVITAWKRTPDEPLLPSEASRLPAGQAAMDASWARDTTTDAAAIGREHGVEDVRQIQQIGSPAEALLEATDSYPQGLLVVGTVGLSDRKERFVGNVPHQLTHHATVDLLLCTSHEDTDWKTVALATDGSKTASIAVTHGRSLAEALGAEATLLTVASSQARGEEILDQVVARDETLTDVGRHVAVGNDISSSLTEAAAGFDLLVLGNKGMSGPSVLLGSVANRITHHVPTNLLLVNTTR